MDAATALQATRLLGARHLFLIHCSQRPVAGIIGCPTDISDLRQLAGTATDVEVHHAPSGTPVSVELDRIAGRPDVHGYPHRRPRLSVDETLGVHEAASEFVPAVTLMRSDVERRDQEASWNRPDDAFFAAGACHVLAFTLLERHPQEDYTAIYIRPRGDQLGSHVYVSAGAWAFDFNGWTMERRFLAETAAECRRRWPDWDYDAVPVVDSLEGFCRTWNHRLPSGYAGDVVARANCLSRPLRRFPADLAAFALSRRCRCGRWLVRRCRGRRRSRGGRCGPASGGPSAMRRPASRQ